MNFEANRKVQNQYTEQDSQKQQKQQFIHINSSFHNNKSQSPLENGDISRFYFQKLINLEYTICLLVILNLTFIVFYTQVSYDSQNSRYANILETILNICFIFSILEGIPNEYLVLITFLKIRCQLQLRKSQKKYHHDENFFTTKKIYSFLLQSFIFLIQPNNLMSATFFQLTASYNQYIYQFRVNDFLSLLSLLKVYVIIRVFLIRTNYMNPRSYRLCKLHGCQADYQFALKCVFKDAPAKLILFFLILSVLIFGYAIQICQRPLQSITDETHMHLQLYSNALWLIIVTMTTVGFGDYYPLTPLGRIIILFVVVWGIFIVSIMVVVVTNTLRMDKAQKKTLIVFNRLELMQEIQKCAQLFINAAINCEWKKKKGREVSIEQILKVRKLKLNFQSLNIKLRNMYDNDDTYEQMSRQFEQINSDIQILNQNQDQLINYIHNNFQYQQ